MLCALLKQFSCQLKVILVGFRLSSPYFSSNNLIQNFMNANIVNQKCEDLEIGIHASRGRFKPGVELSKSFIRRIDVKFDEYENEGKDIFMMNLKVCYEREKAESAE